FLPTGGTSICFAIGSRSRPPGTEPARSPFCGNRYYIACRWPGKRKPDSDPEICTALPFCNNFQKSWTRATMMHGKYRPRCLDKNHKYPLLKYMEDAPQQNDLRFV